MIPITALLNDLDDRDADCDCHCGCRAHVSVHKPMLPRSPSVDSDTSMSEDASQVRPEQPAVLKRSQRAADPEVVCTPDRDSLSESASLMGALTLQALRYSSPVATTETASPRGLAPESKQKQSIRRASAVSPKTKRMAHRRSVCSPTTEEDRRAKQRMIVKRCYYKKINTINDLRQQVQQLEQAFQVLLEYEGKRQHADADAEDASLRVRRIWVDILSEKEALRHENQRLRKLADEQYMKNQSRLRSLLDADRKEINLFTPAMQ